MARLRYAMSWVMFALTLYAGLTMVTNTPFYSFKDINFKRSVPFAVVVSIPLVIALINIHAPSVLFAVFAIYGFSGYGVYLVAQGQGPAYQCDQHLQRRTGRARSAPVTQRPRVLLKCVCSLR